MRAPNPNCPHCHGGGDREIVTRDHTGLAVLYSYEPCPCRYSQPELEEDWTNDRLPLHPQ